MSDQEEYNQPKGTWVPQLFYDVIGRLVPGAILIGTLLISVSGLDDSSTFIETWLNKRAENYPPITLAIIGGFLLSYTSAFILLGICSLILSLGLFLWPRKSRSGHILKLQWNIKSQKEMLDLRKEFSKKYDFIKQKDPAAGNRITKLHAEIHMSQILILGFVVSLGLNFWMMQASKDQSRWLLASLLILLIIGSVGALVHLIRTQRGAVDNYCELLHYNKKAKAVSA